MFADRVTSTHVSVVCARALRQMALHVQIDALFAALERTSTDRRLDAVPALQVFQDEGLKVTMIGDSTMEVGVGLKVWLEQKPPALLPMTFADTRRIIDVHADFHTEPAEQHGWLRLRLPSDDEGLKNAHKPNSK